MSKINIDKVYRQLGDSDGVEGSFAGTSGKLADFQLSKFVVIPVPFEGTVTFGGGASIAPTEIIEASRHIEFQDFETHLHPFANGIHTAQPVTGANQLEVISNLEQTTRKCLALKKFPCILGGEHSISLGAIKATSEIGSDIGILQLDAHSDLREEFYGNKHSHACVMKRSVELDHVSNITQVGIRATAYSETEALKNEKLSTFNITDLHTDWIENILASLPETVYITLDVDAFDPSIIPATGTPEPGGMTWQQVTDVLREVFARKNVIGFDLVELAPISGMNHPQATIAVLAYRMMAWKIASEQAE